MNSHDRVMTAMRLGQPDRVPIFELAVDPKVRQAIHPDLRDFGDLADHLDLDCVGCGAVYEPVQQTPDGWIDEWGVRYVSSPEIIDHPVEGPIQSIDDLRRYQPPDPDADHRLGTLADLVTRYKGRRAVVFHHRAAFMWSCFLTDIENLLIALMEDPPFAEAVMDTVVQVTEKIARNAVRAGADIVTLADDYAANSGPLFPPEQFQQSILPRLQRVVDAVHEEGGLVLKHSDGNLWPILDQIVGTGTDGLNPLEPVAGMDIARVKAEYGNRVCLVGNIDCGELLSHGTVEQVEAAVKQCIADAAPGGGYMLSSSNSIHSSVKPENYVAMVRAGHEYGRYETIASA